MAELQWTDDYSVGDGTVDNDHRGLFAAVNELEQAASADAGTDEVGRIIAYLIRYVNEHFQREERLMHDCSYPDISDHRDRHRGFSQKVYAIEQIYRVDPGGINLGKLVEFLRGWLVRHILGADQDFAPYLKNPLRGDPPSERQAEEDFDRDDFVFVDVEVPLDKVAAIRRCAEILSSGGASADAVMAIVEHKPDLELDEARRLVADLLK